MDGFTVEFKWDDFGARDPDLVRVLIEDEVTRLAKRLGAKVDIHAELMLEQPTVEEVFGAPIYSVRVNGDEAEADSYSGAALALHTLAKENGD